MRCLKSFGERIASRDPDRQTAESRIRIALMNRFNALGQAKIERGAKDYRGKGMLVSKTTCATTRIVPLSQAWRHVQLSQNRREEYGPSYVSEHVKMRHRSYRRKPPWWFPECDHGDDQRQLHHSTGRHHGRTRLARKPARRKACMMRQSSRWAARS